MNLHENFPNQNILYGKALTILVYDSIKELDGTGTEITNKTIREHIIRKKFQGKIPWQEERLLKERIIKVMRDMVRCGTVLKEEHKTATKTILYVFKLPKQ